MKFSIRLKEMREAKGISQAELAEKIGVGISTVGMWESTNRTPGAKTVQRLIAYFGCSIDYLLGRTDEIGTALPTEQNLSQDEKEVLELYGALSPSRKEDLMIYLRALSGTIKKENLKSKNIK